MAKLYIASDAVRSDKARGQLTRAISENLLPLDWVVRVEPALARAVDIVVGDGLATWTKVANRIGIVATNTGVVAAHQVAVTDGLLSLDIPTIEQITKSLTETKVTAILITHRSS